MNCIFKNTEILLPSGGFEKWSVLACDQYTADPSYWAALDRFVGDAPSTLRLIMPEALLPETDEAAASVEIAGRMGQYLSDGTLCAFPDSYVYVERAMQDGSLRRGIVGAVDLAAYDYTPHASAPVRATEQTVPSRLPARVAIRGLAPLELPHIMLLAPGEDMDLFDSLSSLCAGLSPAYSFSLAADCGTVTGYLLQGDTAAAISRRFTVKDTSCRLIVGDGNHSLAAARQHWLNLRSELSEEAWLAHPARYALAEINCIADPAIRFHPIHRVLFHTDGSALLQRLETLRGSGGLSLHWLWEGAEGDIRTSYSDSGSLTLALQHLLDAWCAETGAGIDYIHGKAETARLSALPGYFGLMLPPFDRGELFDAARAGRLFPRKCFSIGSANEKRCYLEARKIK